MLTVTDLSRSFGPLTVLDRISFAAGPGEVVSLVGPSGCGKTVLLRTIAGLLDCQAGSVRAEGTIAYAFQKAPLFPWLSLVENVKLCLGEDARGKIPDYFRAAGLAGFENELPRKISGGMRQKVNVIRAFCSARPLILMDEPFVSLDFPSREELRELTLKLREQEQKTIVFVTHDIDEAIQISDRVLVLSPRPARVVKELAVTGPYPRERGSKLYTDTFREIAEQLRAGHA